MDLEEYYSSDYEEEEENMDFGEYYSSHDDDKMKEDDEEETIDFEENIYSIGDGGGGGGGSGSEKKHYRILKEEEIRQHQRNDVAEASDTLSVSKGTACTLLLRNNWNLNSVIEKWLANDDEVRDAITVSETLKSGNCCGICFELKRMVSASCGHPFCADCWKSYFTLSINDGPGCLQLRCPEPKCKAVSSLDMVDSPLVSDDDRAKYYQYLNRSYIECSLNRKWCPAPGCVFAVEFDVGPETKPENYDVICDCSYKFCWNCTEECHRPVDCETVAKWIQKNTSEADNVTWIAAYTKPCPKCKRPIEKNQGCNHMTCGAPCKFEFCWLCLDPWNYNDKCNVYSEPRANRNVEEAREYLERYVHYYERWAGNHKSRDIARADMSRARNEHIPLLCWLHKEAESQLEFVVEAWEQIVECRRVLKWSYTYGYYMGVDKVEKKALFEYLQGEAEVALERLHHCAEKEMEKCIKPGCRIEDFGDFKKKLKCLTVVTRNYFQNLVKALENHLSEVETAHASSSRKVSN